MRKRVRRRMVDFRRGTDVVLQWNYCWRERGGVFVESRLSWKNYVPFKIPPLLVFDGDGNLPLTAKRDQLSQSYLPFDQELARSVILSFIANSLVCGPISRLDTLGSTRFFPLSLPLETDIFDAEDPKMGFRIFNDNSQAHWAATNEATVPADPSLLSLLGTERYVVFGGFYQDSMLELIDKSTFDEIDKLLKREAIMATRWDITYDETTKAYSDVNEKELAVSALTWMSVEGLSNMKRSCKVKNMLISEEQGFGFVSRQVTNPVDHEEVSARKLWNKFGCFGKYNHWLRGAPDQMLNSIIRELQNGQVRGGPEVLLYAADIKIDFVQTQPKSVLSKVWHEFIGPRPIPFDFAARANLIAKVERHPELKAHIEAWRRMKASGSKWVKSSTDKPK